MLGRRCDMIVRPERTIAMAVLAAGLFALSTHAQTSAAAPETTVTVVNSISQPAKPVAAADVSLWSEDISLKQKATDSRGEALLEVSTAAAQAGGLHIEVTHAGNLVLYLPAGGELDAGLPAKLTIRLLPKGSPALLEPAQIQAMLRRMSLEISALQRQNSAMRTQAGTIQPQPTPDLGAAIAEWAETNGFSSAQVDQQVQQWANGIESQSGAATAEQKALAEMALRHYAAAAQLFNQAGAADQQQLTAEESQEQAIESQLKALQAAQQKLLDTERASLRQLLNHSQQAATADQLNLQYHLATLTLETAAATAQAQFKKHPDDKGFHELWLMAGTNVANARRREGKVAPAGQSIPLLAQSADDFRSLAIEYAALNDPAGAASAQLGFGRSLAAEAARGAQPTPLLDQSIAADQTALDEFTRANLPQARADADIALGDALLDRGLRASGDTGTAFLNRARAAYQDALGVYSRLGQPQGQARAILSLSDLMAAEDRFQESVEMVQRALSLCLVKGTPQECAKARRAFAATLVTQAGGAEGSEAAALYNKAVATYQQVLEVYTQPDLPQDWAETQDDLAFALELEASHVTTDRAMPLLAQALATYQSALQVYTQAGLPQDWAGTQVAIGDVLREQGERSDPTLANPLFDRSASSYQNALQVYTRANLPQEWAATEAALGAVWREEGERDRGERGTALLGQALAAFQNDYDGYTQIDMPFEEAGAQLDIATVLADQGERASGSQATALFDRGLQACQNALAVYTRPQFPEDWAEATKIMARLHKDLGDTASADAEMKSAAQVNQQ